MTARASAAAIGLLVVVTAGCRERTSGSPAPSPGPSQAAPAELPPGHPPTGSARPEGQLPPGHPPVEGGSSPAGELPPGHPPVSGGAAPSDPAAAVSGVVDVAPGFRDRVAPSDVLYIIARRANSRQVLAARREQDVRYPYRFRLSAADAMVEGTAFAGPLDIVARVSKSGDAVPARGDLEGTAQGVALGANDVRVTIDSARQ